MDAVLLLQTVVLLEVVHNYHAPHVSANPVEVLHVTLRFPDFTILDHWHRVLPVESVGYRARNVQFVKHLVRVLKDLLNLN